MGTTWDLLTDAYNFQSIYPHSNGRLFAIALSRKEIMRWEVHVSDNAGKGWQNITGNIGPSMMLCAIRPDPVNTNRVCLVGNCIRNYILEATDGSFTNWNQTREWEWRKDSKTDDEFLCGRYGTTTVLYMLRANPRNYFDFDFGSAFEIPAFSIEVDTNRLEFSKGQKVQLHITVKFGPEGTVTKLPDAANNEEFWAIQCVNPEGKRIVATGRTNRVEVGSDSETIKRRTGDGSGFRVAELSSEHSYSRLVSLDKLADFSKPGTYRMRLSYDGGGWGWEAKQHSGIWGGYFSSPIFTLTIKP